MKDLDHLVQPKITDYNDNENSDSEKALSESIKTLTNELILAKKISKRHAKALYLLCAVSPEIKDITKEWIENLKHVKGNYQKIVKELLRDGYKGLSSIVKTEKEGFLSNIMNRNRF